MFNMWFYIILIEELFLVLLGLNYYNKNYIILNMN